MKLKLLEFLACPSCRSEFKHNFKKRQKDEIFEGTLICTKCNDKFFIRKGIPSFLTDTTKGFVKTEDAFSAKWTLNHKNHQEKDWITFQ